MIIELRFHDYYDGVARGMIDKSVVFRRHNDFVKDTLPCEVVSHNPLDKNYTHLYYIIFCGKLYPFIEKYFSYENVLYNYDIDYVRDQIKSSYKLWNNNIQDKLTDSLNFDWTSFCLKHKTPIIRIRPDSCHKHDNLELNPELKKWGFFKVLDAFQTYQQIYQFISMQMTTPEKNPRPISDKLKAQNHGMDKWSFRRDTPPKRKIK